MLAEGDEVVADPAADVDEESLRGVVEGECGNDGVEGEPGWAAVLALDGHGGVKGVLVEGLGGHPREVVLRCGSGGLEGTVESVGGVAVAVSHEVVGEVGYDVCVVGSEIGRMVSMRD